MTRDTILAGRHPGQRGHAAIGVITVIDEEFEEVQATLNLPAHLPGGTPYYVSAENANAQYDVVLLPLPGRGNIVAMGGAKDLMADYRPPHVLLIGIAGGAADTRLGDVIVPDFVEGYEMRKLVDGQSYRRMVPYDHPSHRLRYQLAEPLIRSSTWLSRVDPERRPGDDRSNPKAFVGNLIAGEKVLGSKEVEYQRQVLSEYENAKAIDMESLGLATAIHQMRATRHYDPQYLVIRGISDLADGNDNNKDRARWKRYAAHGAAAFAAELIVQILALG